MHAAAGLLCLALTAAAAQEPTAKVTPPSPLYSPPPEYSDEARRAHYQGTVVLTVIVDKNGNPENIRVVQPAGLGLDEKAIESVQRWRFKPGMKDGVPVKVSATVQVHFSLFTHDWNIGRLTFTPSPGTASPEIETQRFEKPRAGLSGTVSLAFDVDEKGKPKSVRVIRSFDTRLEASAVASLKKWRFRPAIHDGHPVPVSATIDLTFQP